MKIDIYVCPRAYIPVCISDNHFTNCLNSTIQITSQFWKNGAILVPIYLSLSLLPKESHRILRSFAIFLSNFLFGYCSFFSLRTSKSYKFHMLIDKCKYTLQMFGQSQMVTENTSKIYELMFSISKCSLWSYLSVLIKN